MQETHMRCFYRSSVLRFHNGSRLTSFLHSSMKCNIFTSPLCARGVTFPRAPDVKCLLSTHGTNLYQMLCLESCSRPLKVCMKLKHRGSGKLCTALWLSPWLHSPSQGKKRPFTVFESYLSSYCTIFDLSSALDSWSSALQGGVKMAG